MSSLLRLQVRGPLRRSDLPELYQRACAQLALGAHAVLELEVSGVEADGVALDALARLALAARRHRCQVRLTGVGPELWDLIDLGGLQDVFGGDPAPRD
jgi:ABC-type transporter Mla MlaB component